MLDSRPGWWMRPVTLFFALALLCGWSPRVLSRHLIIGHSTATNHLDPHFSPPSDQPYIYGNLYDTLAMRNQQLDLVPGLATSWTLLDDRTWQFRLRQGVVFHNGEPLTAEDVKFSLERAAQEQPRSSVYATLHLISHVEILDRTTLNVVTKWPDPQLPARLSSRGGMILPRDYFEELGMERFSRQPIGTGPLKFVAWLANGGIIFEAHQRYWRRPVPFARVIFKPYPDAAARMTALLTGQADLITDVSPDQMKVIDNSGVATVVSARSAGFYTYPMNVSQPPLDNKIIRQALHLAINRPAIVQQLWQGRGAVPRDLAPEIPRSRIDLDSARFRFDPDKARKLLAQAGYQGEEILMEAAGESPAQARELTETLAAMFQRVGINARVHWLETSEHVERLRRKTFRGMFLSALTSPLLDSDNVWMRILPPRGLYDYWHHPTWNALMDEARILHDEAKRQERYQQAAELFWEEVPVIVVLQPDQIFALRKELRWKAHGDGIVMVSDFGAGVAPLPE